MYVSTAIFFTKFLLEQLDLLSSLSLAEGGSPVHTGVLDSVGGRAGWWILNGDSLGCGTG